MFSSACMRWQIGFQPAARRRRPRSDRGDQARGRPCRGRGECGRGSRPVARPPHVRGAEHRRRSEAIRRKGPRNREKRPPRAAAPAALSLQRDDSCRPRQRLRRTASQYRRARARRFPAPLAFVTRCRRIGRKGRVYEPPAIVYDAGAQRREDRMKHAAALWGLVVVLLASTGLLYFKLHKIETESAAPKDAADRKRVVEGKSGDLW